jgi:hypothetical protein
MMPTAARVVAAKVAVTGGGCGELVGAQGSGDLAGAGINIALASTLIA